MKRWIAVLPVLALSATAMADTGTTFRRTLVHTAGHTAEIELNENTVICSHADYSAAFLKVLIPELAPMTLLDHQNLGAGAPCVAAGMCAPFGTADPSDILKEDQPTERVDILVRAHREDVINHDEKTCAVSLVENVDVTIRGVAFTHTRFASLGLRNYDDCIAQ